MQALTFITMGSKPEASKEIRDALVGNARARLLADCDDPDQLLADVLRLRPSAVIIILELENLEKEFVLIKQLAATCPETAIISAARDASPALILGSMRSGAREFIQLPIIADEFRTVIDRVVEFCAGVENSSRKNGRVIAVFSGKGGAGVSFFGTNLAAAMGVSTLLIDLNLQAGDAAFFLGLDTKYSLTDFVNNRARLDDSLMTSLVTTHSANLAVLAAPLEAHEAEDIKPQDVVEILHLLGQRYECIVLDLPHTFDPVTVAALDLADEILVVLTLDIPGIRSTKRALKVFDRLDYQRRKVHVVVNRWSKNIDVQLQKVEMHLGEQLIGFVPNDYRKVMDSINLGRPLVQADPSSKITAEIKRIAALVGGNGHPTSALPRKKLLGGMFNRQRPTAGLELSEMPDPA
ncbi:MAG: AAA family ATPase [Pyrinomonadaceae bacterium]|nr:AAA family ATPase [Pyrinomonadaceae bacterium]